MIRSLYSGVSGLRNHQLRMDTLSNNIANVNTTGFKAGSVNFQDALNQVISTGGSGRNPMQTGTGITTASISTDMSQGPLQMTGRSMDVGISGEGFFAVKAVDNAGVEAATPNYTRDGSFFLDDNNYLVDSNGDRIQGTAGDIQLSAGGNVTTISIDKTGLITYSTDSGASGTAQLALYTFPNKEGLEKDGENLYSETSASGAASAALTPGSGGAGSLESGYLEMSNTDLSTEMTNMITTQRGYQACARVITVSDTLLQELIDLKRS